MSTERLAINLNECRQPPPANEGMATLFIPQNRVVLHPGQGLGVVVMHRCATLRDPNPNCPECHGAVMLNGWVVVVRTSGHYVTVQPASPPPEWSIPNPWVQPALVPWTRIGADPLILIKEQPK